MSTDNNGSWPIRSQFSDLYEDALQLILEFDTTYAPRGLLTREVIGAQLTLTDARNCLLDAPSRNLNHRFAVAEWLWILAGRNDVQSIARYNQELIRFSDDGKTFAGAYGPRLAPQWGWVVNKLREDPDTRQAVVTVWTPAPAGSLDIPCTVALQFLNRAGRLHAIVTMRSSDAWLGLPYDVFNFAMITNWLASQLNLTVGSLTMQLGSLHLYEPNWRMAETVLADSNITTLRAPALSALPRSVTVDNLFTGVAIPETGPWQTYYSVLHVCKTRTEAHDELKQLSDRSQ